MVCRTALRIENSINFEVDGLKNPFKKNLFRSRFKYIMKRYTKHTITNLPPQSFPIVQSASLPQNL